MDINNDFISFEEASLYIDIDKYTLGRVKRGYLAPYIENKKFNIKKYNQKKEEIQDQRHISHCLYFACIDIYDTDEELSKWLSYICGRTEEKWFHFLDFELFSIDKNDIILNWYEIQFTSTVYDKLRELDDVGSIDLEFYLY